MQEALQEDNEILRARKPVVMLAAVAIAVLGFCLSLHVTRNYIDCDYDSAGLIAAIDYTDKAPFHAVRPLFTPTVLMVCRVARGLGISPVFPAFFVLYALVHVATVLVIFVTGLTVSGRLWIAVVVALIYMVCGSQVYLLRLLEDNLLATLWLAGVVLALVVEAERPRRWAGVLAGVCLGIAVLFGRHCIAWLPVLLIPAALPGRTWIQRLRFVGLAGGISFGLAYLVTIVLAVVQGRPEFCTDPYTLYVTRFPEARMFDAAFPWWVRGKYLLLGVYYSMITLPADMGQEWNMAYSQISQGALPGVWVHAAVAVAIVMFGGVVLRSRDTGARRVAAVGMFGLLLLTGLNLTAIDGSFPERFDYFPLLWTAVMAGALKVAGGSRRWLWNAIVLLVCAGPMAVNCYYVTQVGGQTRWQYADLSRVTRLRAADEPVVLRAAIGNARQYDFMCKAVNLWLTTRDTWLLAYPSIKREGSMIVMPEELADTADARAVFYHERARLPEHGSYLLNQEALDWLRDEIAGDGVQMQTLYAGHDVYYRAVRCSKQD